MKNVPFYDRDGVKITKGLFEVPSGRQFSIKNIDSVDLLTIKPGRRNPIICMVVGLITIGAGDAMIFLGLVIIGLGIWWWKSQKNIYRIMVTTAGTKDEPYYSYDREEIIEIRSALNAAIEAH